MFRSICSRLTCSATPQRPARPDRPLSPEKSADETWKEIEDRCSPNLKELLELVNLQAKARFNCMYFGASTMGTVAEKLHISHSAIDPPTKPSGKGSRWLCRRGSPPSTALKLMDIS